MGRQVFNYLYLSSERRDIKFFFIYVFFLKYLIHLQYYKFLIMSKKVNQIGEICILGEIMKN